MLDGNGRRFAFCTGAPAKACSQAPGFLRVAGRKIPRVRPEKCEAVFR